MYLVLSDLLGESCYITLNLLELQEIALVALYLRSEFHMASFSNRFLSDTDAPFTLPEQPFILLACYLM